ncbi:MAG: tetratricopeptide repeat protein [Deltaproteobacteria bacterium]|nr:tetratricopeptide repeat protein [Deltaproteobacteria bacterium]
MAKQRQVRAKGGPATPRQGSVLAGAALIAMLTVVAYAPSLRGGFILDDDWYVTNQKLIQAPNGLYRFWLTSEALDYYPVSNTTLWVEWRLWGLNPTGYRVTNLLLHLSAVGLIWLLLQRLRIPGAFLAALLFAVHPVNVESVAWIAQRKGMLALPLFLLSLYAYLRADEASDPARDLPSAWGWYGGSLVAFVLAMLSKGSVGTMPLAVLAMIAWRRPLARRDVVRIAPFVVIGAGLVLVNAWYQARATAVTAQLGGPLERLLTAGSVVWFYLYKALLPFELSFIYPKWNVQPANLWWWLPGLAAALVTGLLLWRGRQGWQRGLLVAWIYFCAMLIPVMGFSDVGFKEHSLVADHYQHLALIGVLAVVAAAWAGWRDRTDRRSIGVSQITAALVVALLTILTWRQSGLYRDAQTLYAATLVDNPDSWLAHHNLSFALLDAGRSQEALEHMLRAEALRPTPDYDQQANLAALLFRLDRVEESLARYARAVTLRPESAQAHYNLATALVKAHRLDEAVAEYRRAIALRPDDADTQNNFGAALLDLGRVDEARQHFQRAAELNPNLADAPLNLGRILLRGGAAADAIAPLRRAVSLNPASSAAENDLGVALVSAGQVAEGVEHLRKALQLDPNNGEARANLDESLAMLGQPGGAR